jgi:3-hydroxyisobutyrate dehydrogenase-like beta-hydroxyacid dehydrogenase
MDYGFPGCDGTAQAATMPAVTTAIIGVGKIGSPLARRLVGGGEPVHRFDLNGAVLDLDEARDASRKEWHHEHS